MKKEEKQGVALKVVAGAAIGALAGVILAANIKSNMRHTALAGAALVGVFAYFHAKNKI